MPLKMYDGSNVMYECCILIIDAPVGLLWDSFEYSGGTLFEVFLINSVFFCSNTDFLCKQRSALNNDIMGVGTMQWRRVTAV